MKLIIELDNKDYELAKADKVSCGYQCRHIMVAVKNGTPYNPSGDAISREALKNALNYICDCAYIESKSKEGIASDIIAEIDNAQAVEPERPQCNQIAWEQGYEAGLAQGKHDRPQGEWGKWVISEIRCPEFLEYFDTDCYSTEELKKCPCCGATMKGGAE